MPLFIDSTPIKAVTPTKDMVNALQNADLDIENIDWCDDSMLVLDTCTEAQEEDAFYVCFESTEDGSKFTRALLYIDDDDRVYEKQEADADVTYERVGKKILAALADL
jgi:hypothetical protein